jgi:hypothetical protein
MFKKTVAFVVSVVFSLMPMTLLAGSHKKTGSKKWDPSEKPVGTTEQTTTQQTQEGQKVLKGEVQSKAGKKINVDKKQLQKRVDPGRVF